MLFTFQYVPICFYYFSFYDTITDFVSKIYIPICFYYFKKSTIESISYSNLHSNMFLLFRLGRWRWGGTVSRFTFQYVSIISFRYAFYILFHSLIYIPICFYYFMRAKDVRARHIKFTFQYVSIISWINLTISARRTSFTFQYVSIISFTAFALLAQPFLIYIPICFYYFASGLQTVDYASGIYIPICFYYFWGGSCVFCNPP